MKYHIEKITADNRRPGMKHPDGFLIRYRPHRDFGWLSCRTVATENEAILFATTQLDANGELLEA